ncbi:MAG: DUF975 family protein [Patescibacteria group bacterium]
MQSFSIKEALTFAWNTFKKEPWLYGGIALVALVISIVVDNIGKNAGGLIEVVVDVVSVLVQWWIYLGFARIALNAQAGRPINFKMLFAEKWETLYKFALVMVLTGVIVVIGFVLLIVPGIIAQLMLSMVVFITLEKHMGIVETLKESRRLTDGHKWNLFGFMLVAIVINILGALLFGVGLLVTIPVTILALTYIYKKLDRRDDIELAAKAMPMPAPAPAAPTAPSAPAQM